MPDKRPQFELEVERLKRELGDALERQTAAAGIPVASSHQDFARDGAHIAMGPSFAALARGAAGYVDKIFKGAKISDLPVQRPSVFTTIINLKTAKALGLTILPLLLARADEVIE